MWVGKINGGELRQKAHVNKDVVTIRHYVMIRVF